jgi:hypothetical protein
MSSELTNGGSPSVRPTVPPLGWDADLWFAFKHGADYEREVPRDFDGRPLIDENGLSLPPSPEGSA